MPFRMENELVGLMDIKNKVMFNGIEANLICFHKLLLIFKSSTLFLSSLHGSWFMSLQPNLHSYL